MSNNYTLLKPFCRHCLIKLILVVIFYSIFQLLWHLYVTSTTLKLPIPPTASLSFALPAINQYWKYAQETIFVRNHGKRPLSLARFNTNIPFRKIVINSNFSFGVDKSDVFVFLHIQKTGGTLFENFLAQNLDIQNPCKCNATNHINKYGNQITMIKNCDCYRFGKKNQMWLFFRHTIGWACGVHPDFTGLFVSGCVDKALNFVEGGEYERKYYFLTILRDPIERFFSEYRHVKRGAMWLSKHFCDGRSALFDNKCFKDSEIGWKNVTFSEFLECPYNLGFNRQTRMLADLTLINCYNGTGIEKKTQERLMLESAKRNLRNFAFFGIKERWDETQLLFEKTFNLKFNGKLGKIRKRKEFSNVSKEEWDIVFQQNSLDIQLYAYANQLFSERLKLLSENSKSNIA